MKKEKIKLDGLKVISFVTLAEETKHLIQGGHSGCGWTCGGSCQTAGCPC